jgi:hypothetical protein
MPSVYFDDEAMVLVSKTCLLMMWTSIKKQVQCVGIQVFAGGL